MARWAGVAYTCSRTGTAAAGASPLFAFVSARQRPVHERQSRAPPSSSAVYEHSRAKLCRRATSAESTSSSIRAVPSCSKRVLTSSTAVAPTCKRGREHRGQAEDGMGEAKRSHPRPHACRCVS
eukprot:5066931-Prymnesium_polylepis.1